MGLKQLTVPSRIDFPLPSRLSRHCIPEAILEVEALMPANIFAAVLPGLFDSFQRFFRFDLHTGYRSGAAAYASASYNVVSFEV
jgi:hypothetical protein